jgi:site-specific recombinase XerD
VDKAQGLIRFDLAPAVRNGSSQVTGKRTKKRRVPVPIADWLRPVLEQAQRESVGPLVLDTDADVRRGLEWACIAAARQHGNARFKEVTPHVLRHTAATHMTRAGVPLWEVAGVLGDTMATVQRVYAHHCPEHLRAAVGHRAYG